MYHFSVTKKEFYFVMCPGVTIAQNPVSLGLAKKITDLERAVIRNRPTYDHVG